MSFFWHDYETFGRNPRRDRPSQFAGIRTDAELNEVGEPLALYCQPTPDFLPEPEACLLTGITPQQCLAQGVPEPVFADAILAALAEPDTIAVGYNSLRFDDEVTRHLLWRNLQDPYGREWQNGNARWDLLDTVRAMHALRPEGLAWPRREDDDLPSFKLEHLSAANGLAHEAAHDAVSDVRATIALARAVRAAQPKLWDFCLALRAKQAVWQEIGQDRPFLHASGMYGSARNHLALVWPLAMHPTNANELIVWDLAHDPAELEGLRAADIRARLYTRTEDLPEGVTRLPIKTIHVNRSPVVVANLRVLSDAQAAVAGIDLAAQLARVPEARRVTPLLAGLWPDVYRRDAQGSRDVDEALYDGFIGRTDRQRLDRQRREPGRAMSFDDARLDELAFRWRARHHPALLTEAEQQRWQEWRAARLHLGAGGGLTLAQYAECIDTLYETADARGQAILEQLSDYAEQIAPQA